MIRRAIGAVCLLVLGFLVMLPGTASAQTIAGVVKDTSGAIMPGVTVEATSPALIEKVRTVVSDERGEAHESRWIGRVQVAHGAAHIAVRSHRQVADRSGRREHHPHGARQPLDSLIVTEHRDAAA